MSLSEASADTGAVVLDKAPVDGDQFAVLDLASIVPSLTNPRTFFNEPRLAELAESIKASGVHQPVLVRPLPGSRLQDTFEGRRKGEALPAYELVAGERRYRASKIAGAATIPAMIRALTDDQVLEVQLIENLQRDDLHPMEEAEGYERLAKATGISKEELGAKVGKSRGYVYARLKLLELTAKAREAFLEMKIDASRALVIARIPDTALQEKALAEATREDWQGSAPSFRSFVKWAQQNVMLRLDAARFKITNATLVAEAGSCGDCTKRTGAAPDLFADVDSADVCIDPTCFHAKEAAHEEAVLAVAKAKGQRVIPEREAKKLWSWEGGKIDGYVRLDRPDERVGGTKMLKTVLGKDMPEPILMQNPHKHGELIEVLPADKVRQMLKDSGRITTQQARSDRVISSLEAERNALAKYEKTWRKRAIAAVHAVMADSHHGSEIGEGVCRLIANQLLDGLRGDERQHVCELLGLGKVADRAAIEDYLRAAEVVRAEQAMYLILMQQDMLQLLDYGTNKPAARPAPRIEAVAADYQVALSPIQQLVKAELEEAAKPKKVDEQKPSALSEMVKPRYLDKKIAPPTAHAKRGKKLSAEEVQGQIAEAFQALDQSNDQAPDGANQEEEGAAPAAQPVVFRTGQLVRIKAGTKGPTGKFRKTVGKVGYVAGAVQSRIVVIHGPRSHERIVLPAADIEAYDASGQIIVSSRVRVLIAGMTMRRNELTWREGTVAAATSDGWQIDFPVGPKGEPARSETFEPGELEVLS